MHVTVRFTGLARTLAGRPDLSVTLAGGATLADLLDELNAALPAPFVDQVLTQPGGSGRPRALVLVNGRSLRGEAAPATCLADGDVVAFVPPMEGGSCAA